MTDYQYYQEILNSWYGLFRDLVAWHVDAAQDAVRGISAWFSTRGTV